MDFLVTPVLLSLEFEALGILLRHLRKLRSRKYWLDLPAPNQGLILKAAPMEDRWMLRLAKTTKVDAKGVNRLNRLLRAIYLAEVGNHPDHPSGEGCIFGPRAHRMDDLQLKTLARYLKGENLRDLRGKFYSSNQTLMQALRQPIRDAFREAFRKRTTPHGRGWSMDDWFSGALTGDNSPVDR